MENIKYLELLSQQYPTIESATVEIINLRAILNLPKGTEHFISDLHGEYEAFLHMIQNASGVIRSKIDAIFGNSVTDAERRTLATLIYYPEQKLEIIKQNHACREDWYKITLYRLVELTRSIASKYTRSKVRKAMPKDFEYIIDELLHSNAQTQDKEQYYEQIIHTIISLGSADKFILALARLIQRLAIDHLHILGDIYDRGPGAEIIVEALRNYHSLDIQWGNHDIVWMGAAAGSEACIANVIRVCSRYSNLDTLEDGYGISLRPLITFALEEYGSDPCVSFQPVSTELQSDKAVIAKMHKAISIIQFKLEGQIILRHPEYEMERLLLLDKIKDGRVDICGKSYELTDTFFPTLNPDSPFELSEKELEVMRRLRLAFINSEKLQSHTRFLYSKGGIYTLFNSNLIFHGCLPMTEDGGFDSFDGKGGKEYFDAIERIARNAYFAKEGSSEKKSGEDFMWYLWCGKKSPLFGKSCITTFERYFVADKETWREEKNPYYKHTESEASCIKILKEFGLPEQDSHIINGHVPVKSKEGESPIKANGRLFLIDGGLSKVYQKQTGIAGYTLISNSYGFLLTAHEPFESTAKAIEEEQDIHSSTIVVEKVRERKKVASTDVGSRIKQRIGELEDLLEAYRSGAVKERR